MSLRLLLVLSNLLLSTLILLGSNEAVNEQNKVTCKNKECEELCVIVDAYLQKCNKSQEDEVYDYLLEIRRNNYNCWITLYEKFINWFEQSRPYNDSLLCKLYTTLGAEYKDVSGQRDKSFQNFRKALSYGKSVYPDSTLEIYKIYYNFAETYNILHNNEKSILYADTALYHMGYDKKVDSKERCYGVYARAYARLGDEFMFEGYDALAELYAKASGGGWSYYINDLIKSQKDLKNYKRALDVAMAMIIPEGENQSNVEIDNKMRIDLHEIYINLGDYDKAEFQLHSMSKPIDKDTLIYFNNMASLYTEKNEYAGAKAFYIKSIDLSKKNKYHEELFYTYHNIIELFINQSRYDSAYHYLQLYDELKILYPDQEPVLKLDHKMKRAKNELITLFENSKQTDNSIALLKDAYNRFLRIDSIINNQINEYTDDQSLMNTLEVRRKLYDQYLPICIELHQLEPQNNSYTEQALSIVEKNKSVILLSNVLKNRMGSDNADITDAALVKDSILDNISYLKDDKIAYETRLKQSYVLCRQLRRLRSLYNSDEIPEYIQDNVMTNSVSYDGRNFLMYHNASGNDNSYYRIYNVDGNLKFDKLQLADSVVLILKDNFSQDKMSGFPKMNLKPISDIILPENLPLDVMIIPDHHLSFLPFEMLPYNGKYLIHHTNVSYGFSLSHQNAIEKLPSPKSQKIICFAPSYHLKHDKIDDSQLIYKGTRRSGELLTELEYNVEEIESISDYFSEAVLFKNDSATKQNFFSNIQDASIIHIAAHATASTDVGDNYIYFCSQDSSVNYALSLAELYDMNIPAELVTLSACETGVGKTLTSEGVLSLARGFAYAGSKSIVSSLWSVEDESTSIIMGNMYKYLKDGDRKDVALRKAKLEYLDSVKDSPMKKHPAYWAGFVAIGDMSPINDNDFPTVIYILLGVVIAVVITYLLSISKKNTKLP